MLFFDSPDLLDDPLDLASLPRLPTKLIVGWPPNLGVIVLTDLLEVMSDIFWPNLRFWISMSKL